MIELFRNLYGRLSNQVKAGLATAAFTFVTTFGLSLVGWVQAFVDAVSTDGDFPELSILGRAVVSAAGAAVVGAVNYAFRAVQARTNLIPGSGPSYDTTITSG